MTEITTAAKLSRYARRYGGIIAKRPDYTKCAHSVVTSLKWNEAHQCSRSCGHGPDGAYCKQHANNYSS